MTTQFNSLFLVLGFALGMAGPSNSARAEPLQDARARFQAGSANEAALYAYEGCQQNVKLRCLQAAVYFSVDGQNELAMQMLQKSGGVRGNTSFSFEVRALTMAAQTGALTQITPTLVQLTDQLGTASFLVNLVSGAMSSAGTVDNATLEVLARLCLDSSPEIRQSLKSILGSMTPDVAALTAPVMSTGQACSWASPQVRLHRAPPDAMVTISGSPIPTQVEGEDVVAQVPLGPNVLTVTREGRIPFELEYRAVMANEVRADVRMDMIPPAWTGVATYGGVVLTATGLAMLLSSVFIAENARSEYLSDGGDSVTLSSTDYEALMAEQSSSDRMSGLGLTAVTMGLSSFVIGLVFGPFSELTAPEWR
ncbi:MAG: hypothetical protein VYC39_05410 [Myxococcota bacterium]|nr:hypothetical protein [Myxococcota bacterium]